VRWLWVLTLIVVIAVAGIFLAWLALSADEEPIVAFDGNTATYNGPTTLEAGEITLELENSHDEAVAFGWAMLRDETITVEGARAWAEANPGEAPPFATNYETMAPVLPGDVIEADMSLVMGATYMVYVGPSTVTGKWTYPAGRIEVTDPRP
jgi:hypothetical protein